MKRLLFTLLATILLTGFFTAQSAQANGGLYIVQPGDTLYSVAARYGVSVGELAAANGFGQATWVYEGQQLVIPGGQAYNQWNQPQPNFYQPPPAYNNQFAPAQTYYPTPNMPVNEWVEIDYYQQPPPTYQWSNANLYNPPPVQWNTSPAPQGMYQPQAVPHAERWIDVNLTNQTVTAFEGQTPVFNAVVSTGMWQTPTVVGTYEIYVKYDKTRMTGGVGADYYDLPDVPYVMYFYKGYGLHGTYWHNNFGTPMSHGCVNLATSDAHWLYNWAQVGTRVVSHY